MNTITTTKAQARQVWYKLAENNLRGPEADNLLRVLTMVCTSSSTEGTAVVEIELTEEEYKEWIKYGGEVQQ